MTTIFNTSFLSSPEQFESAVSKKGYRSSKYNNFVVEVVDFDNEVSSYEIEAESAQEAGAKAQDIAQQAGTQVNYCNVYEII